MNSKNPENPTNHTKKLNLTQKSSFMKKHHSLRTVIVILIILASLPITLNAKDMELSGMLRSYTGTSLDLDNPEVLVSEQTLDITLTGWGKITRIVANPYAYIDTDLTPALEVREAYIDLILPDLDIRIGKQAVVWGEADGAFITDIVSPQNMRSFILADFKEIRMGIPAVKADYYTGPFTIEGVWIPAFVPTVQPTPDSLWALQPDMSWIPSGMTVTKTDPAEITSTLKNSEIFTKVSYFGSHINAELMAGSAWDDYPVFAIDRSAAPNITITPTFERYTILGGSLSAPIGSAVLRSEAAAYIDRSFNTSNPDVPRGIEQHNQLQALAGADWSLFGARMSAQYIVQYIDGYDSYMLNSEEFTQTATFLVQDTFFSDTLTARFFGYFGLAPFDALLRPSLTWSIEDGVSITAGAEIFLGDDAGKFGQFTENSLGCISLKWYF